MASLNIDLEKHSHASQMEPAWHQDCLSLTVILAAAFDIKAMRKLLTRVGYNNAANSQRPEDLLEALHIACHQDPDLVDAVTKTLNKKYRSSLTKTKSMQVREISEQAQSLSWPVPLLWSCYQHDTPDLRAQGRRLAHMVLWNAVSRLRQQPRIDDQQERIEKLAQENQTLRNELRSLRRTKQKTSSPKAKARPATTQQKAPLPAPEGIHHEIATLKKTIKPLRRQFESEKRHRERLQKELAVWRALALNREQNAPNTPCPGIAPLQSSIPLAHDLSEPETSPCAAARCDHCPLQGTKVAVIGGLKRMETNYCQVVGKLGGQCLCHTGNVANGCRRLRQTVRKADLVVFLTTVNSHTAMNTAKDECKKRGKPFYTLDRTGAGSLEKTLLDLSA